MRPLNPVRSSVSTAIFIALLPLGVMAQPDLSGTWLLVGGEGFTQPEQTPLGRSLQENYDFAHDDPSLQCIPASWTRVYSNPNTPVEITQHPDRVAIRYELFDIERSIPLIEPGAAADHVPADPDYPTLGANIGWYDGDELVVHSNGYGDAIRVLTTIRGWAGLHQSPLMVTEERYSRPDAEILHIRITHFDPLLYREPLVVTYDLDAEYEWRVEPYGCVPEEASVNTLVQ